MNDLSTSKPSRLQNTWSSLPWGTFLFLLAVFVFATPLFRFNYSADNALTMTEVLGASNWMRIGALITLGVFALFNLLRSKQGRFQINGLLGWLILFYLVWAALSITWSIDTRFTTKRVGILLILFMGALYFADRFSFQEILALVFFICAVAILIGLVIVVYHNYFFPFSGWWRFGGNMHPTGQGWNCGLLLLSALALSKTAEKNRSVYLGIAFIAFLLLVLTRSRGPFASCMMASTLYWILTSSTRYKNVLFFLGIIIMICLIYFSLGNEFRGFSENVINLSRRGGAKTMYTLTGRMPLWKELMVLVDQRPFVGYGYDSFLTSKNLLWIKANIGWETPSAHSGYISTLGGLGYTGAVTLVLILFLSVKKSLGLAKENSDYAFIAAVFAWLIFNMFTEDQILTRPYFPVFVWMIMLARLGFIRQKR